MWWAKATAGDPLTPDRLRNVSKIYGCNSNCVTPAGQASALDGTPSQWSTAFRLTSSSSTPSNPAGAGTQARQPRTSSTPRASATASLQGCSLRAVEAPKLVPPTSAPLARLRFAHQRGLTTGFKQDFAEYNGASILISRVAGADRK